MASVRPTVAVPNVGTLPARRRGRRRARRTLVEDRPLQRLELRSRVEPEVVGEQPPDPAAGGQGVALATAAPQRRDQRDPQALAVRRVGDQRLELTDDAAGRVELGAGGELGFEQPESQLRRAGCGGA